MSAYDTPYTGEAKKSFDILSCRSTIWIVNKVYKGNRNSYFYINNRNFIHILLPKKHRQYWTIRDYVLSEDNVLRDRGNWNGKRYATSKEAYAELERCSINVIGGE